MFGWAKWPCRVAAAVAAAALTFGAGEAQATPPGPPLPYASIDDYGVDLTSGQLNIAMAAASVGDGAGLAYLFLGRGLRDNLTGTIADSPHPTSQFPDQELWTVSFGDTSASFVRNNATAPFKAFMNALGQTLVYDTVANTYTYTRADGAVAVYSGATNQSPTVLSTVTRPAGEQLTYTYTILSDCGCARVQAVTSNLGYMLKYQYAGDTAATGELTLTKVTAINLADDYCDPTANGCTLANTWTSATFSGVASGTGTFTITDSLSRTTTYTLTNDQITQIQRPGGATIIIGYDTNGRVSGVSNAAGTRTYGYVTDPSGQFQTTVTYPPRATDPTHPTLVVVSDPVFGRVTSVTDSLNHATGYQYDTGDGRTTGVVAPEGNAVSYAFDARGNITTVTRTPKDSSLQNQVTTYIYDTTCSNPKTCNKPNSVTENGSTTDYTYDPNHGGVLTVTGPAGVNGVRPQTRLIYTALYAWYLDSSGQVVQAPSPVYKLTGTSSCQTLASCSGTADEIKTTIGYGSAGTANNLQPITVTSGSGDGALTATNTYTYDIFGDVLTVDGPLPGAVDVVRNRYDAARQLVGFVGVDPDVAGAGRPSLTRKFDYNPDGQLGSVEFGTVASQSDADWLAFSTAEQTVFGYDSAGRKVSEALVAGGATQALTQYSYDAANRLDCTAVRMNPATFAAPPASACTLATTGANGPDRISRNTYDLAQRLSKVTTGYATATPRDEATTTYTPNGKVQTLADANGNLTTYSYDALDRPVKTQFPSAANGAVSSTTDYVQLTYDPATANPTQQRRRDGQVVTLTYDGRHRVISKNTPASTYAYDNLDRLSSATQGGQTLTRAYDALGRVSGATGPLGTVGYLYDPAGNRIQLTWPDGYFVTYNHDNSGAVTSILENGSTTLATFGYDSLGRRQALTRGNTAATTTTYGYDPVSRLASLAVTGTTKNQTLTFGYNAASQILTRTSTNTAYAWPGLFNVDRGYTINGLNQVDSTTTPATLAYDGRGNLTSDGSTTYSYDIDNRLTGTSSGATLAYDPADRLYQTVSSGGSTTRFAYDSSDIIGEYDGSGNLLRRYVHGPGDDEPLVAYTGSATTTKNWLVADQQGSIVAAADDGGAATVQSYDEYGIPGATNTSRFQYTGQTYIPELGLYNYKARIYSPVLGRFLQTDPIGYGDGLNIYAYVHGDPVNADDPDGMADHKDEFPHVQAIDPRTTVSELIVEAARKTQVQPAYYGSLLDGRASGGSNGGAGGGGGGATPAPKPNPKNCNQVLKRMTDIYSVDSLDLAGVAFTSQLAAANLALKAPNAATGFQVLAGGAEFASLYYGFLSAAASIGNGNNVPGALLGITAGITKASQLSGLASSGANFAGALATGDSADKGGNCP
jgi:RHS repeat-associated protein